MSTTVMNVSTQIPENTSPLTREEMAAYYTAFMVTAEKRDVELKDFLKQQADRSARIETHLDTLIAEYKKGNDQMMALNDALIRYFAILNQTLKEHNTHYNTALSFATTSAKLLQIADKMESRLESTPAPVQVEEETPTIKNMSIIKTNMPGAWRSQWVTDVFTKSRDILAKQGKCGNGATILRLAYAAVSDVYPDFDKIYAEYLKSHPGTSKIVMCSDSDKLRELIDQYLDNQLKALNKPRSRSAIVTKTPDKIYQIAGRLFPNIRQNPHQLYTIYSRMRRNYGCNLNELTRNYAKSLKFSKCAVGYTIANNKKLLSEFEDTIALMIKEKEGAK